MKPEVCTVEATAYARTAIEVTAMLNRPEEPEATRRMSQPAEPARPPGR